MSHIGKAQIDPFRRVDQFTVAAAAEKLYGTQRMLKGIGRFGQRFTGTFSFAGLPFGLRFLNMGGVLQHDIAQVAGHISSVDRTTETILIQFRQHT